MNSDDHSVTRKNIPRRGPPMPMLEQDLVQRIVGNADQRHQSMPCDISEALLEIKRVSARLATQDKNKASKSATSLKVSKG